MREPGERPRRRWLPRAGLALAACFVAYLVGANLLLGTGALRSIINKRPEKTLVEWRSGWSVIPGVVHVEGLRIRGQTKKMQWQCRLDRGTFRVSLLALPFKTIRATKVRGTAFSFHSRKRLDVTDASIDAARFAPEIDGLSNPPDPTPESLYPPRPKKKPWQISLSGVHLEGPIEMWISQLRVRGEGTVVGGMKHQARSDLEVPRAELELRGASLTVSGDELVVGAELVVDASLSPFVPKQTRGLEILQQFRGQVRLSGGRVEDVTVLNGLLPPSGKLKLISGAGSVELTLDASTPQDASGRFEFVSEQLRLSTLDTEVDADLKILAALKAGDLVDGRFEIDGTSISIENAVLTDRVEDESTDPEADAWWLRTEVPRGTFDVGRPARADVDVGFAMKSAKPLLEAFFSKPRADGKGSKTPGWLGMISELEGVEGSASVNFGPDGMILDDVLITSEKLDLMARLKAQAQTLDGQLYVRYGVLRAGVALLDGKKKLKLSRPLEWFMEQPEYLESPSRPAPPDQPVGE